MKEWSKQNELCSFNSMKGLLYAPWYQSIRDWHDGKIQAPLPPIEASLDPIHACNLLCDHCNAHRYLTDSSYNYKMSDEHLLDLTRFLGKWGVKAICYGGGGEPSLHPALAEALSVCTESGMESSVATNATAFTSKLIDSLATNCRWVGISIDAATPTTYEVGRKAPLFFKAISNMEKLVLKVNQLKTNCDVAFKFLIFNYNQHEIYEACRLAKQLGVKDFHARPADYSHQGMGDLKNKIGTYDIETVFDQFEKCHELETDDFRVFTVVHKFDDNLKPRKDFCQCFASSCCIQLCGDGNAYLCPDQRFSEAYKLGVHTPPEKILEFWGGKKHYDLVFKTGKENCNTRCTFSPYNVQAQKLFMEDADPMCWKFI